MCKKSFVFGFFAVAAAAVLSLSCNKKETVKALSLSVTIDETALVDIPRPDSYNIKVVNVSSANETTAVSETNPTVVGNLVTGVYDVTVSAKYSKGGFSYNCIGTVEKVEVNAEGASVTVPVEATKVSVLVFKEIYYSGTKTADEKPKSYFRDQFYEIYNNGEETVYADGLCLGEALSENTFEFPDDAMPSGKASDYLFFQKQIWQVPGDGDDYPIAPGESFIIAQYAIDHSSNNSLDLSSAEFETYIDAYSASQTDGPAINLNLVCNASGTNGKQYLTSVFGSAMVLFRPSSPIKDTDYIESSNLAPNKAREILKSDILDAVDFVKNETTDKRLSVKLDNGKKWCSGAYVNESMVRKLASEGGKVYQDDNDSSSDFEVVKGPQIRRNGAVRPSWSTWGK